MKALNVIGLNSGTSMDGIDAALFRIQPVSQPAASSKGELDLSIEMLAATLYPFEDAFQRRLQAAIASGQMTLASFCRLNVALGEVFADSALHLLKANSLSTAAVDLIGSHGQTIWHAPVERTFWGVNCSGSLQLGEPAVIAERTRLRVIADFRAADLAAGGQGAPLVCFADQVIFGRDRVPTGVLNLGGIANITVIDSAGQARLAFDTGPGNMVIDRCVQKCFGKDVDYGGQLASSGKVDDGWLATLLEHKYFQLLPPKTTGREDFGQATADRLIETGKQHGLRDEDLLATLTALTAASIAQAYRLHIHPHQELSRIVLGGGGAENSTLIRMIKSYWPGELSIARHEDFGISTKFKEALLFALLAYTTYWGIPNNIPACTGAKRKVCLGKICQPR